MKAAGYRSDPIKAWKASLAKQEDVDHHEEEEEEEGEEEATVEGSDFMYLLSMNLLSLTKEKKDALLKERDAKVSGEDSVGSLGMMADLVRDVYRISGCQEG